VLCTVISTCIATDSTSAVRRLGFFSLTYSWSTSLSRGVQYLSGDASSGGVGGEREKKEGK
jgi:hypothetical protein